MAVPQGNNADEILPGLWLGNFNASRDDVFLKTHLDAEQLPLTSPLAGLNLDNGQLQPSAQHDGLFYALLQKQ